MVASTSQTARERFRERFDRSIPTCSRAHACPCACLSVSVSVYVTVCLTLGRLCTQVVTADLIRYNPQEP
eukprot:6691065-Prymnesium_polylepis.1